MKIAVTGPDGAGKSTLCNRLNENYVDSKVIHAVKHSDHFLFTTSWAYKFLKKSKDFVPIIEKFIKYLFFYPFEYIENLRRFTLKEDVLIYDRHPIDRVILKFEISPTSNSNKKNKMLYKYELYMRSIWGWIYLNLFPKVDYLIVLLPTPEICFKRADGQYNTIENSSNKIAAYRKAIDEYIEKSQRVISIEVTPEKNVEMIFNEIIELTKLNKS